MEVQGDGNVDDLNFAVEPYLQRQFTDDEQALLTNLLHDDGIDDGEKYDQIRDQLLNMEVTNPLLRLPNGQVAQGNADNEPLWCSAKRIGLQILHIHSRYYISAVRVPVDNDVTGNNDELQFLLISVSKTLHLAVKKTLKHSLIVLPNATTLRVSA